MKTILVDDDEISRTLLSRILQENTHRVESLKEFGNAQDALHYAGGHKIDLAILDIKMPGMDGLELASSLRELYPDISLIFETGFEQYAVDALRLKVAGYIFKPYDKKEIDYAIESAYLLSKRERIHIYAKTFGHFDLFVDRQPVCFKSAKAKELLALLVDRQGGILTSEQMIAAMWEDRPNDEATQNLASKVTKTLQKELNQVQIGHIIHVERGMRNLNTECITCDLYEFLDGKEEAVKMYNGLYMSDYSWGEYRIPMLERLVKRRFH